METALLPDKKRVPALVHNDVSGAHERSSILGLYQVVLAEGYSVLPSRAARCERETCEPSLLTCC